MRGPVRSSPLFPYPISAGNRARVAQGRRCVIDARPLDRAARSRAKLNSKVGSEWRFKTRSLSGANTLTTNGRTIRQNRAQARRSIAPRISAARADKGRRENKSSGPDHVRETSGVTKSARLFFIKIALGKGERRGHSLKWRFKKEASMPDISTRSHAGTPGRTVGRASDRNTRDAPVHAIYHRSPPGDHQARHCLSVPGFPEGTPHLTAPGKTFCSWSSWPSSSSR